MKEVIISITYLGGGTKIHQMILKKPEDSRQTPTRPHIFSSQPVMSFFYCGSVKRSHIPHTLGAPPAEHPGYGDSLGEQRAAGEGQGYSEGAAGHRPDQG